MSTFRHISFLFYIYLLATVLAALDTNVDLKAKGYKDLRKGGVFLLNNHHYVFKVRNEPLTPPFYPLVHLILCFFFLQS
jgi:hypothetical protein